MRYPTKTGRTAEAHECLYDVWVLDPDGVTKWRYFHKWSKKLKRFEEYIEPHWVLPQQNEVAYCYPNGQFITRESQLELSRKKTKT